MEHLGSPFEWPRRQKRSHNHIDQHDRNIWSADRLSHAHDLPLYRAFEHQQPDPSTGPSGNTYNFEDLAHSQYTPDDPLSPQDDNDDHPDTSGLYLLEPENMAPFTAQRFEGDGFDYRRPAGFAGQQDEAPVELNDEEADTMDLSSAEDVIDLTADDSGYGDSQNGNLGERQGSNEDAPLHQPRRNRQPQRGAARLPRGMDIIIDLDNGLEEWRVDTPPVAEPRSPEFEIISSRRIDNPRTRSPTVGRNNNDGDEVQFVREQPLPQAEIRRRRNQQLDSVLDLLGTVRGRFAHLRAQVDRIDAQVNRGPGPRYGPQVPPRAASRTRGHFNVAFEAPMLDFDMVGFDLGMGPTRPAEPPAPTYKAPEPVGEGFTRSAQEHDVLVCPNCDSELCTGDDETKRQVWIVKGCGHVYCGECTTNRAMKKSTKGKERTANTKSFKECVVEGCGKRVISTKSMVQVFL